MEIKYRIWDIHAKKFLSYPMYLSSFDGKDLFAFDRYFNTDRDGLIFQQWTTLLDRTGRPIYDGDIVSVRCYSDWNDEVGFDVIYFVDWCDKHVGWRGFNNQMKARGYSGVGLPGPITVIGNIFENPDLLK